MKRKIFISAALLAISIGINANAQITDTYFNCDSDSLEISGQVPGASDGESAVLLMAPQSNEGFDPVLSDMFYIQKEGEFFADIHLSDSLTPGKYVVRVGSENSTSPYVGEVIVFDENDTDIKNLMIKLNESKSPADMRTIINNEGKDKLVIVDDIYSDNAIELCHSLRKALPEKEFSAYTFVTTYRYAYVVSMLSQGFSADDAMKRNAEIFETTYEDYKASDVKSEIDSLCSQLDYSKDFITFEDMENIAKIRSLNTVRELWDFIEDNSESLNISSSVMKKFDKLSINKQNKVFSDMIDKIGKILSLSEIEELFEDAVEDQSKSDNKSSSGGSGGFGGSVSKVPFQAEITVPASGEIAETDPNNEISTENKIEFSDMISHWAKDDVCILASKGIVTGYGDGTFKPEQAVTRAELVKLIANAFELSKTGENIVFSDVDKSAWYYDSLSILALRGIVNGDGNRFNPNEFITREDAATIISRTLDAINYVGSGMAIEFSDKSDISDYATSHVDKLSGLGIIKGSDNGFNPKTNLTRGEIAAIINRTLNLIGGVK